MGRFRLHPADLATAWTGAAMAIAALVILRLGPARSMPVAWGLDGTVTAFAPKEAVALVLGCLTVVTLVIGMGVGLAARTAADDAARVRLRLAQLGLVIALALVAGLGAAASLNGVIDLLRPVPLAVLGCVLLLLIGLAARVVSRLRTWHKVGDRPTD